MSEAGHLASSAAEVVDRVVLTPDPGLVASLGTRHSIESSLADLVDNSIDAGATRVRIRFVASHSRLVEIWVVDDGRGMNMFDINAAMTIGRRRKYTAGSLGNFGVGLKAAALSNAETLTVWSEAAYNVPVGRRLRKKDVARDFSCEVLSEESAEAWAAKRREMIPGASGTIVLMDDLRTAYHGQSAAEAQTWLSTTIGAVRMHLGVVFHRMIRSGRIAVEIDQSQLDQEGTSIPVPVPAIDPFGYVATGHPDYPREISADVDGASIKFECHIWPGRNDVTGFRMGNKSGEDFQGFYVYRADRLLQVGGWESTTTPRKDRQLARVVIDDDSLVGSLITMNPEKQGIRFEPTLLKAIDQATSADGNSTFHTFIQDAEEIYKLANRRSRKRKATVEPGKGFGPRLRKTIERELDFLPIEPVDIRWKALPEEEFFDVDYPNRTLWLNAHYREVLVPDRRALNDAPLLKALVYLLTRDVFAGQHLGSRERDNVDLWRAVLGTAVSEEARWQQSDE